MRLTIALLMLALIPMAQAREDPGVLTVDPDVYVSPDGCEDCWGASLWVVQSYGDNCADCGGIGVVVGVEGDSDGATASAQVCRGGFVVICVVDEEVTV